MGFGLGATKGASYNVFHLGAKETATSRSLLAIGAMKFACYILVNLLHVGALDFACYYIGATKFACYVEPTTC